MSEQMNPVGWFEIYVDDLARARAFYEAVLGYPLTEMPTPDDSEILGFASVDGAYGATGALVKMDGMSAGQNSTIVYFHCADCAVEESRVVAAGGKVQQSKMSIGEYGFAAMIQDTEGNIFGLHSLK